MVEAVTLVLIALVSSQFLLTTGWADRSPTAVLAVGLGLFCVSVQMKIELLALKSFTVVNRGELELAASLIEPLLCGIAVGLVSAAMMMRAKQDRARTVTSRAARSVRARQVHEFVLERDRELKQVAKRLSNDEFWRRWSIITTAYVQSLLDLQAAERDLLNN